MFGVSGQYFGSPASTATPSDIVWEQLAREMAEADAMMAIYSSPVSRTLVECTQTAAEIADDEPTQIQYTIQIVEDRADCLHEYESLRRGAPLMMADSKTLLPAMRALNKHELIRQLSAPKIICTAGEKAELQIDSEAASGADGVRIAIASEEFQDGLKVDLAMHSADEENGREVRTQMLISHGQAIVQKVNPVASPQDEPRNVRTATYIVVTPEIVK
jgi:hypothetical protein